MKVAIPSYNRVKILKEKTLNMLLTEGFDPKDIYVFLKNEEQLEQYKAGIESPLNWVVCHNQNLSDKRTFIRRYFAEGEEILSIDDDVKRIKFLKPQPLKQFVSRMFELLKQEKLTAFGIYPVNQTNMFYCKDRVVKGSVYLVGSFYGFLNKQAEEWPTVCDKEDKWFSCKRITEDGAVLRYEGCCADTSFYAKGGLSEYRTLQSEEEYSKRICNQFPELVKYTLKKNNHPDVKFLRKKNTILSLYPQSHPESQPSPQQE